MKFFIILFLFVTSVNSFSQDEFAESLGLNLENESDLAVYMMLYQIGLKDTGENILGVDTCVDVSRDEVGNTKLSFGINTDAFKTGTADFSQDNDQKFKHINGSLSQLFSFFKSANYKPNISVRSYADPQQNIMSKYAPGSVIDKKYSSKLFGANANEDKRFDTDSKRRNYLLAYDRGEEFIDKYFPEDLKGKVKTTPFNSSDLEVGNNQNNSDEFACPNRRSIVVDMKFNPNLKIQSSPGEFTPGFKVATGSSNNENILAAVFDAHSKKLEDLPEFCRNKSTEDFIKDAKERFVLVKKLADNSASIEALKNVSKLSLEEDDISSDCEYFGKQNGGRSLEKCLSIRRSLKDSIANYSKNNSEENLYNLIASMTFGSDNLKKAALRSVCKGYDADCKSFKIIMNEMDQISERISIKGKSYNSSHFMDCFSNKLYYKKELKENIGEYITQAVELRDPITGEMKISYTEENIPKTARGNGFLCQACGNGLRLQKGVLGYQSRASTDHTKEQLSDSLKTYDALHSNPDTNTMFMMGHQKGLNLYIIKDCKIDNFDKISENSQMVSVEDLKVKKIKIGPNDCIFKPKVINSCVHAPAGEGKPDDNNMSYIAKVPSFLTNKTISTVNEANANIMNNIFTALKDDYIKTCQFDGEPKKRLNKSPKEVIGNVLCKTKGIHIPSPSFDSKKDCPEIAKRVNAE